MNKKIENFSIEKNDFKTGFDLFYQYGFVVIRDMIPDDMLKALYEKARFIVEKIKERDPNGHGNRGPRRYSLGSASLTGHWIHEKEWLDLCNLKTLQTFLATLFHSIDYIIRGGGGDVCLSKTTNHQPLHRDISEAWHMRDSKTSRKFIYGSFYDPRGKLTLGDLPCPFLVVNVVVEDLRSDNGPTKLLPGTQHNPLPPSTHEEEHRLDVVTLAGVKKGSIVIRDARTWHGGTPNLSNKMRLLPNLEVYAPWYIEPLTPCLPSTAYQYLNAQARHATRFIMGRNEEIRTGIHRNLAWGKHLVSDSPLSF